MIKAEQYNKCFEVTPEWSSFSQHTSLINQPTVQDAFLPPEPFSQHHEAWIQATRFRDRLQTEDSSDHTTITKQETEQAEAGLVLDSACTRVEDQLQDQPAGVNS